MVPGLGDKACKVTMLSGEWGRVTHDRDIPLPLFRRQGCPWIPVPKAALCLIAPDLKAGMLLHPCPHSLPPQGQACPRPQRGQFTSSTHRCPVPGSNLHPGPSRGPVPHPGSGRGPAPVTQPGAWPRLPPGSGPPIRPGPAPGSVPARPRRRARPDAPVPPRSTRPGPWPYRASCWEM